MIFEAIRQINGAALDAAERMQKTRAATIGEEALDTARPAFNAERARNLVTHAETLYESGEEVAESQARGFSDTIENNARLCVDDAERELAEARYQMGKRPVIVRTALGANSCEWCRSAAGEYEYGPQMDKTLAFGRHANCDCLIEYDPGTGKTETVRNYHLGSRNREALLQRDADFFVGRNGKALLARYKDWIGENQMRRYLDRMQSKEAKDVIRADFRPTSFIGRGNTADARKFEKATGLNCGRDGKSHAQKVKDLCRFIEKTLLKDIPENDKIVLNEMLSELEEVKD